MEQQSQGKAPAWRTPGGRRHRAARGKRRGQFRRGWHPVGTDLHAVIARCSGNSFIAMAIEAAMTRRSPARWLDVRNESSREQARAEKGHIPGFIRNTEADAAVRDAAGHIHDTRDRLLRSLNDDRRGLRARGFAVTGMR